MTTQPNADHRPPVTTDGVVSLSDQNVGTCPGCGFDGTADCLMDTDAGVTLWKCPDCGAGNRRAWA